MKVFVDDFTGGIIKGFKSGCSYSDVSTSPIELPTNSQIKNISLVILLVKVNICPDHPHLFSPSSSPTLHLNKLPPSIY
jgi:hypothetical protein